MKFFALLLALALLDAKADPLLREWIERQADIRSLRADFEQTRRLPALRIPLKTTGTVWIDARGNFRWQVGDPPEFLAIRNGDALLLVEPKKKRARRVGEEVPRFDAIPLPFAKSLADLGKRFEVLSVDERDGRVEVDLAPRDSRVASGLKSLRVVFRRATGVVEEFELDLRDGSRITTTMTRVVTNPGIPAEVFEFDVAGYRIEDRSAEP